ncbi:DUF6759 domain-containing protein [Chryseobacterium polytrichastri]|uniref:DUF6759 domain-containing protein n=1 Tax=Chryseobacterium polytrichastri TaxID=1302687 RepID=A0A1M7BA20_9FLAO|nr:DUF6759 domain-containing protein [Chryseobacterium polytrichastri]SHL51716.1 hypothetical protein SAMN05444267_101924 [Chryseobacterium polytrichastri]
MKKTLLFYSLLLVIFLNSCSTTHYRSSPTVKGSGTSIPSSGNNSASQVEREYSTLIKTYKPETAEVLTDILNGSDGDETSITVENNSKCNMVLTISGNNYFKKIPIGANKIGSAMVPKNQNYSLSGMVCNSIYQKTKFISSSFKIKLSN